MARIKWIATESVFQPKANVEEFFFIQLKKKGCITWVSKALIPDYLSSSSSRISLMVVFFVGFHKVRRCFPENLSRPPLLIHKCWLRFAAVCSKIKLRWRLRGRYFSAVVFLSFSPILLFNFEKRSESRALTQAFYIQANTSIHPSFLPPINPKYQHKLSTQANPSLYPSFLSSSP